jgi:cytochrome c553
MKTLIPLLCTLFLLGCNDTVSTQKAPSVENTNQILQEVNTTSVNESQPVVVQTSQAVTPPAKVQSTPFIESKPVKKPVDKIKTEPQKASVPTVVKEVKQQVEVVKEVKQQVEVVKEVKPLTEVKEKPVQTDASALYGTKCASCHGAKAEKPALGKSQVIAGWSTSKIEEALHGYQAGTYGKEMKALMTGQAKSLSAEQIKSLAKYISTL